MTFRQLTAAWVALGLVFGLAQLVDAQLVVTTLGLALVAIVGTSLVILARNHTRAIDHRPAQACLGFGAVAIAMATMLFVVDAENARPALQSPAGLLGMIGVAIVGFAVMLLLCGRLRERSVGLVFEGALCVAAVALVPWAFAMNSGVRIGATVAYLPLLLDALVLWLAIRLVLISGAQRVTHACIASALTCLLIVDAVNAGIVQREAVSFSELAVLQLWACCAIAIAALHLTLRSSIEPIVIPPRRLGPGGIAAPLGLTVVPPAVFALQAATGDPPRLAVVLSGSTVIAFLVAAYLIRQVQESTSAEYRARHDPLTGLPHRAVFQDRLEVALAQAGREGTRACVMFLDLDRFKMINDSLGHAIGNQLLQGVAERLKGCFRESDTVARVGGDEFMVLLPTVDDEHDCSTVAGKVLEAFTDPFSVGSRQLVTSASIGIALFPEHGNDADTLAKNADLAMYRAKTGGRNGYTFYTSDMSARARVKHSLGTSLRTALEAERLQLQYQPRVDARTGEVVGFEALARWPHPELGYVPPNAFIPLAEEMGLIIGLGEWVLEECCRLLHARSARNTPQVPIAINVSARELMHERIDHRVASALDRYRISPDLLEIEITESIFLHDLVAATEALYNLRDLGVRCSVDDFGTGYSGLTYLSRLPIYSLKIDQSFVEGIGCRSGERIVDAIITMARSLDMRVIAEGVETDEQATFLVLHGCDEMQGLLFSPPLNDRELDGLLSDTAVVTPPVAGLWVPAPGLSDRADALGYTPLGALLQAVCNNQSIGDIDEGEVASLLASLRAGESAPKSRILRPQGTRIRSARAAVAGRRPLLVD